MAEYKETHLAGKKWQRFGRIVIDNPRHAGVSVLCVEQEVLSLGAGEEVVRDIGNMSFAFDPNANFPLLNPDTNEVLPQTAFNSMPRGMQTYVLVYSYTLDEAKKRDEQQ